MEWKLDLELMEAVELHLADGGRRRPRRELGKLYPPPYHASPSIYSFATRIARALSYRLAKVHATRNRRFQILLTPALPPGELRLACEMDHFLEVYCGLSPSAWQQASIAAKRQLLIDAVRRALCQHAEFAGVDEAAILAATQAEADSFPRFFAQADTVQPIRIGMPIARELDLKVWDQLDQTARLRVADEVVRLTNECGHQLGPPRLQSRETRQIAECHDKSTGLTFSLIPGGELALGFDPPMLTRFHHAFRHILASTEARPTVITPFGADAPCDLRRRETVRIEPCWLAREVVTTEVSSAPRPRFDDEAWEVPPRYTWDDVIRILGARGWALPTSDQFEWAVRGGDSRIFSWGDDFPALDFSGEEPRDAYRRPGAGGDERESGSVFPHQDGFGLRASLAFATWCQPRFDPDEPFPIMTRGGAMDAYPWQGGHEALLFLTAVECRHAFDGRCYAWAFCLRPIIPLTSKRSFEEGAR